MKTNEAQSPRRPFLEAPLTGAVAGAVIASATWALSGLGQPVWNAIAKEAPSAMATASSNPTASLIDFRFIMGTLLEKNLERTNSQKFGILRVWRFLH